MAGNRRETAGKSKIPPEIRYENGGKVETCANRRNFAQDDERIKAHQQVKE
jgi:hypothetical protein